MNNEHIYDELLRVLNTYRGGIQHIRIYNEDHWNNVLLKSNEEIDAFILNLKKRKGLDKVRDVWFLALDVGTYEDFNVLFRFFIRNNTIIVKLFSGATGRQTAHKGVDILKTDVHDSLKRIIIDNIDIIRSEI